MIFKSMFGGGKGMEKKANVGGWLVDLDLEIFVLEWSGNEATTLLPCKSSPSNSGRMDLESVGNLIFFFLVINYLLDIFKTQNSPPVPF